MKPVDRVTLQSMEESLGTELAIRSCAPIALFMLLKANGYLPTGLEPDQFMKQIDRGQLSTTSAHNPLPDWSRPALTGYVRQKYGANIVSWQFGWPPPTDFSAMEKAGYIETGEEIEFFKNKIEGRSVEEIVRDGYPVIATMNPGFGTPENKIIHAIIILEWHDDEVIVVDPDARNNETHFSPERVKQYLAPKGAGTVILANHE